MSIRRSVKSDTLKTQVRKRPNGVRELGMMIYRGES
jgi:hypothetical protein